MNRPPDPVSSGTAGTKATAAHEPPRWWQREPGRLIGRGHNAGDLLEAYHWEVLDEVVGMLRVAAHVPDRLRNPRGQLFGGFTGTYVDLLAIFTARAGSDRSSWSGWLATREMRIDYLAPVVDRKILLEGRVVHRGRRSYLIECRLLDTRGALLVLAHARLDEAAGASSVAGTAVAESGG